ncbi:unnamed protein product [Amoebophrya sp. A120]|nr:unnamed protein product [Amoebophrya sp. A120]|eukprot:GSA120T00021018001.1
MRMKQNEQDRTKPGATSDISHSSRRAEEAEEHADFVSTSAKMEAEHAEKLSSVWIDVLFPTELLQEPSMGKKKAASRTAFREIETSSASSFTCDFADATATTSTSSTDLVLSSDTSTSSCRDVETQEIENQNDGRRTSNTPLLALKILHQATYYRRQLEKAKGKLDKLFPIVLQDEWDAILDIWNLIREKKGLYYTKNSTGSGGSRQEAGEPTRGTTNKSKAKDREDTMDPTATSCQLSTSLARLEQQLTSMSRFQISNRLRSELFAMLGFFDNAALYDFNHSPGAAAFYPVAFFRAFFDFEAAEVLFSLGHKLTWFLFAGPFARTVFEPLVRAFNEGQYEVLEVKKSGFFPSSSAILFYFILLVSVLAYPSRGYWRPCLLRILWRSCSSKIKRDAVLKKYAKAARFFFGDRVTEDLETVELEMTRKTKGNQHENKSASVTTKKPSSINTHKASKVMRSRNFTRSSGRATSADIRSTSPASRKTQKNKPIPKKTSVVPRS